MGSPSPPPPPPDYTQEKSAFARNEFQRRKQQAEAYNQAVTAFNNNIGSYADDVSELESMLGGLTIRDDEKFGDLRTKISGLNGQLGGLFWSRTGPQWSSTVYSPWGAVDVGMPELFSPNLDGLNNFRSRASSFGTTLAGLQAQRREEEQNINNFYQGLYGNASGLQSRATAANIGSKATLDQLRSEFDQLKASRSGFTSEILDDYNSPIAGMFDSSASAIESRINDLFRQRTQEEDRVKQYEQGILSKAGTFGNTLTGLTIQDESGINSLQRMIDDYQREVMRFSTPLGQGEYDFSQELGEVQSVEDRLAQLLQERQTELSKTKAFEDQLNTAAMSLASGARTADMYNAGRLDDLLAQVELAKQQRNSFSGKIAGNFGIADSQLSAAEQLINQLKQQRTNAMNQIRGRFDTQVGGIDGLQPYDEAGMNAKLNSLYGFQNQLSQFTGSDADAFKMDVQTRVSDIQQKLQSLNAKRSEFEQQAQQLLATVNSASYTDMNGVTQYKTQAQQLQDQVNLYKAMQAMDELTSIMQKLDTEKKRLETDAANVAARTAAEQANPLSGTNNISDLMNRVSPEQYAQLMQLAKKAAEGDQQAAAQYNAFLQSLGIGV